MRYLELDDIKEQPPGVLDRLPVEVLANLQAQAEAQAADAASLLAILHGVLTRRYAEGLNDTGTHNRTDGDYTVKITVPKRVDWDQAELAKARRTLESGWGEDPDDYIDTKYSVAESKYAAWPTSLKALFTPARTVKSGKPTFKIMEREAA